MNPHRVACTEVEGLGEAEKAKAKTSGYIFDKYAWFDEYAIESRPSQFLDMT